MMRRLLAFAGAALLVGSCSGNGVVGTGTGGSGADSGNNGGSGGSHPGGGSGGSSGGGSAGSGGGGVGGGGGPKECQPASDDLEKCPCPTAGDERACWPGPPGKADVGPCRKGTQLCFGATVLTWGACDGAVLPGTESDKVSCSDGIDNDCSGKVDCQDPLCEELCLPKDCTCIPGAVRWCDTPVRCSWGLQTCLPDGNWGLCVETQQRLPGCPGLNYSACCCRKAGACCEAGQTHGTNPESVGNCAGIACNGLKGGPELGEGCSGRGICFPGAKRGCTEGGEVTNDFKQQTCQGDGSWGPCNESATPPPCTVGSTGKFWPTCCAQAGMCCQDSEWPDPIVSNSECDMSVGACKTVACK